MGLVDKIDSTIFSNFSNTYGYKGGVGVSDKSSHVNMGLEKDSFVPENLTWILHLEDRRFEFVGSTSTFGHLKNILFIHFIKLVPKYFMDDYLKGVGAFVSLFSPNGLYNVNVHTQLHLLIPMRLLEDQYFYVKQTISPKLKGNKLVAIQIVNISIKRYEEENYNIMMHTHGRVDWALTKIIKRKMAPPSFFSIEQKKTIELICEGYTSGEIAFKLNKTKAAVYKLNRKILEKISNYFEIEFNNVHQAVTFYTNCFEV